MICTAGLSKLKTMQRNWIGKSFGADILFDYDVDSVGIDGQLKRFTPTCPDTLMGATYVAVAAEHPLAQRAAANNAELTAFIAECKGGSWLKPIWRPWEKRSTHWPVCHSFINHMTNCWCMSPTMFSGAMVKAQYIMAVPAHDERDFALLTSTNCRFSGCLPQAI